MKGAEELGELLFECNKAHDKVLDWWNANKDDEVFNTEEGIKLRNHLGGMIKQEALAVLELGIIELSEAMKRPDIFISEETYNKLKEALELRKGS